MTTLASPFVDAQPPSWASGWGQDEYGFYADFRVVTGPMYWDFVSQRMRWIPPGTFLMGSPENEAERADNETQHEVTISRGFWLAATTCSQQLWQAVMGENPSHLPGDNLPVEQVSYEDVQQFLDKTSDLNPKLNLRLPTEAEWEYACRAGTSTPFCWGETITSEQANYFDPAPYQGSTQGEFRKQTVPVDAFEPNAWGIYQMHGNVWERCRDWYGEYEAEPQQDPTGPEEGSGRVIRGGSWDSLARSLRSACRFWLDPGDRNLILGFRCLSSVSPGAERVSASTSEPRDEAAEKRRTK